MASLTVFEPLFQELRIRKVLQHMPRGGVLVDVGCDQPQVFIDRVRKTMKRCIGIDEVVKPHVYENVRILQQHLGKKIDIPKASADVVTMMAVLEHMKYPDDILKESARILRPGGMLLVTVPSPASKPFLEIFARIGVVRKEMIEQHENYFTPDRLRSLCKKAGFRSCTVELFEKGCNTFLKAVR
ncbi:MAG TPA: class I SAM-dependent methyltransferase [Patescibacteria group bacterium]|nr:class I SAM-dependent methyltransferase [Patescibacteria group bacterium]